MNRGLERGERVVIGEVRIFYFGGFFFWLRFGRWDGGGFF